MRNLRTRFAIMNFMQFAVWGSYLTSMGTYLFSIGMGEHIGMFYAMQGIVSLFMPALMGILADRYVPAQKAAERVPHHRRRIHDCRGLLRHDHRQRGAVCNAVHALLLQRGVLHAYPLALQLRCLQRTRGCRTRPREGVSADTHSRHHRFHLHDVVCRPDGIPAELQPVLRLRRRGSALRCLRADAPTMPGEQRRRKLNGTVARTRRLQACSSRNAWRYSSSSRCSSACRCRLPTDSPTPISQVSAR